MMPTVSAPAAVTILLSTYNGARYLSDLLDSLRAQTHPRCALRVRDDGSTDETLDLLRRYRAGWPEMAVVGGNNLGVNASFFTLLTSAPDAAYYAFADQDDVWLPEKIARSVARLGLVSAAVPALYCGPVYLTDARLRVRGRSGSGRGPSFGHALIQNIAPGCTMVLNHAARVLLCETLPDPGRICMYDWWAYLLVAGAGTVVCDEEAYLLSRQHAANTVGMSASRLRNRVRALADFLLGDAIERTVEQARQLEAHAQERLTAAHRAQLSRFLSSRGSRRARVRYALRGEVRRNTPLGTLAYHAAAILKKPAG